MRVGDRVLIIDDCSGVFVRRLGVVTATEPAYMIQIDGERMPLRFGPTSLAPAVEDQGPWTAGGE